RAEQLILLLGIVCDKACVAHAAPTLDMAGVFRLSHNLSRRRILRGPQGLIEHLPENRFIRGGEWVNHVIHNLKGSRLILIAPDYAKKSREQQVASAASNRSPKLACFGEVKVSDLLQAI